MSDDESFSSSCDNSKNRSYTIAVLGYGHNRCYPPEHVGLMKAIEENGATISQYQPDMPPMRYNFPQRNKMIAALSDELWIAEAGKKSETASTIEAAQKYGRNKKEPAICKLFTSDISRFTELRYSRRLSIKHV